MGRVGKGGGEPGLRSGSALFPMESKVARGNKGGEGERAAKFAACKKTPTPKKAGSNDYMAVEWSLGCVQDLLRSLLPHGLGGDG